MPTADYATICQENCGLSLKVIDIAFGVDDGEVTVSLCCGFHVRHLIITESQIAVSIKYTDEVFCIDNAIICKEECGQPMHVKKLIRSEDTCDISILLECEYHHSLRIHAHKGESIGREFL